MLKIPDDVRGAAADAASNHPSDAAAAAAEAEAVIRALPGFEDYRRALVSAAVLDLVYAARHQANVATRRQAGRYGVPAKVRPGGSPAVERVYRSVYDYYIAGTTLGALRGDELQAIAESEQSRADGHLFNARLCVRLARRVPPDSTVSESVSEAELRKMFKKIEGGNYAA